MIATISRGSIAYNNNPLQMQTNGAVQYAMTGVNKSAKFSNDMSTTPLLQRDDYNNLFEQFQGIKDHLRKIGHFPEELAGAKERICESELPRSIEAGVLSKLEVNAKILAEIIPGFSQYVKEHDKGGTLTTELRICEHLIERYKQDLDYIRRDLEKDCLKQDNVEILQLEALPLHKINALDEANNTLLMKAVDYDSNRVIATLLKLKANPFTGDKHGNTAFSIALKKGDIAHALEFIKIKLQDTDDHNLSQSLEDLKAKPADFEYFIATTICTTNSDLRTLLGLDKHQALTCFAEAQEYYCAALGDSAVDISDTNQLL